MAEIHEEINALKRSKGAVVMAHHYQPTENQKVADHIGDSLDLAQKAASTDAKVVVVAGTYFMAEMAKVLCPNKQVLLPNPQATCEMADMVSPEDVQSLRKRFPGVPVVAYVNSSAAVKAVSDICCTSRNAVQVVRSLGTDRIIFVPDENMARYVKGRTGNDIQIPTGYCYVHKEITPEVITSQKGQHPGAKVLAHPECSPEVLALADNVSSTNGMFTFVQFSTADEFIIATEDQVVMRMREMYPDKKFYGTARICRGMKATTLDNIRDCLANGTGEIVVPADVAEKARRAIDRMLQVS